MNKKLKITIFIRQPGDYDWVRGFLLRNISRADFTVYLHAGTPQLPSNFEALIREEFSCEELNIICGPIVSKYLNKSYEYVFSIIDRIGRKNAAMRVNLSALIRPILKIFFTNKLGLGEVNLVMVSNSHHRDLSFEMICALSPEMKLVIFPHAPAIFSAFTYSKVWLLNDYDLWLESCRLSDWSLSHDKTKVAFVGLQGYSDKKCNLTPIKKKSIVIVLQRRPEISGMSFEELRNFLHKAILKSKSLGMPVDIKPHPNSNREMEFIIDEIKGLGCKILPPSLKKIDYANYFLCLGMWSSLNIYFVAAGIPVLVIMPESYDSNIPFQEIDTSFYYDNVNNCLSNKYFDSGLLYRICSPNELDFYLSDKSALDAVLFEQQKSFSRYWPYTEMFDFVVQKLF